MMEYVPGEPDLQKEGLATMPPDAIKEVEEAIDTVAEDVPQMKAKKIKLPRRPSKK